MVRQNHSNSDNAEEADLTLSDFKRYIQLNKEHIHSEITKRIRTHTSKGINPSSLNYGLVARNKHKEPSQIHTKREGVHGDQGET